MSSFTVSQRHHLSRREAAARLDPFAQRMASEYSLDAAWRGNTAATFSRSGLEGSLFISDSSVKVEIDHGFALRPFSGKIRRGIEDGRATALR